VIFAKVACFAVSFSSVRSLSLLVLFGGFAMAQPDAPNPFQNDPTAIEAGRGIFRINCAGCHGMHAEGGRGPNLTRGTYSHGNRDQDLFAVISNGVKGTEMSSFSAALGEENVWRLVAYLRSTTRPDAVKAKGDPTAGEKLFWGKGGCGACHRVGERGGRLGPDLSGVGKTRSLEYLRDSVVTPSADITPGYATITVLTRDGKAIVGVERRFDGLSAELMDPQGNLHSFRKSEVVSITRDFISLMPGNYAKLFSASELDDLLAYLSQLGAQP
jgi:putative heme-binding domain-containing protein